MPVQYEITVPIKFAVPTQELNRVKAKVSQSLGSVNVAGAGAPAGLKAASGGGGSGDIAEVGQALRGGFLKIGAALGGLLIASKIITGIFGNQFSALGDLLDQFGIMFQLFLKPISDIIFAVMLPVFKALLPILPLWYDFVNDPAKGFVPLFDALAENLANAIGGIFGIDPAAINAAFQNIKPILASLGLQLSKAGSMAKILGSGLFGLFGTVFNDLKPSFDDISDSINENLMPAFSAYIDGVGALIRDLVPLGAMIAKVAGPVVLGALQFSLMALNGTILILSVAFVVLTAAVGVLRELINAITGKGDEDSESRFNRGLRELKEFFTPDLGSVDPRNLKFDDFISRPGQPVASFSSQDTLIGVKDLDRLGGTTTITNNFYGITSAELPIEIERIMERSRRATR